MKMLVAPQCRLGYWQRFIFPSISKTLQSIMSLLSKNLGGGIGRGYSPQEDTSNQLLPSHDAPAEGEDPATAKSFAASTIKNPSLVPPPPPAALRNSSSAREISLARQGAQSDRRRGSYVQEVPDYILRCADCGASCETCLRMRDVKRIHPDGDAMHVEGMDVYGVLYSPSVSHRRLRLDSIRRHSVAPISTSIAAIREHSNRGSFASLTGTDGTQFEVDEEDGPKDGCCGVSFTLSDGIVVQFWERELSFDVVLYLLGIIFIGIAWFGLWTALPPQLTEPAGAILGPMATIIACTFVGQYIVGRNLGLPHIVGIFFSSIIRNQIYEVGFLSRGTSTVLHFVISRVGLTTILVRAGMALSWKAVRPTVFFTATLATVPLIVETVVSAGLAYALFTDQYSHNWKWAFLHGFMCSVIAAGIVAPELLSLVAKGYNKGPVALALSSVGFDTAIGVWAIGFMNQLIFSDLQVGLLSGLGPVQLIGGVALGFFIAFLFCMLMRLMRHNLWKNPVVMRRFTLAYFLCIAFAAVFFGEKYDLSGGAQFLR